jgi:hypothetical protein
LQRHARGRCNTEKLGDGHVPRGSLIGVEDPDVAGCVNRDPLRAVQRRALVTGGGADGCAAVVKFGKSRAGLVRDPNVVCAVNCDTRWPVQAASGPSAGGRDRRAGLAIDFGNLVGGSADMLPAESTAIPPGSLRPPPV